MSFIVSHPDLPECQEGNYYGDVNPQFRRNKDGRVEFLGWYPEARNHV